MSTAIYLHCKLFGIESIAVANLYYQLGVLHSKHEAETKQNSIFLASGRCFSMFINSIFHLFFELVKEKKLGGFQSHDVSEETAIFELAINLNALKSNIIRNIYLQRGRPVADTHKNLLLYVLLESYDAQPGRSGEESETAAAVYSDLQ